MLPDRIYQINWIYLWALFLPSLQLGKKKGRKFNSLVAGNNSLAAFHIILDYPANQTANIGSTIRHTPPFFSIKSSLTLNPACPVIFFAEKEPAKLNLMSMTARRI